MVNALKQIRLNKKQKIENEIVENEIDSMIRNDPVTCARYYRNRINARRQLICHNDNYYGKIKDYFYITEFQNRGSEHDHGLLWIKDAPIYGTNTNEEIETFVDRYLSCNSSILEDDLKILQHHRHTKTCRKNKNKKHCRFNFPQPPIKNTRILEPMQYDNETTKANAMYIFETLQNSRYDETYTFDRFLEDIKLSHDNYIHAIQCTLNRTTMLLQRKPCDIWTNSFAKHIPKVWNANTDC